MEEGGNLARTIPTSNPDPDQEQGGLGVWCGVNRQRAERSRALGSNKSENQKDTPLLGALFVSKRFYCF
jgi:hypothetical protein